MDKKLIIFDFFGVVSTEVAPQWFRRYFPPEEADRRKAALCAPADRGDIDETEYFCRLGILTGEEPGQVMADWLALAEMNRPLLPLLAQLRANCPVALLSNAPAGYLHRVLSREHLYSAFDTMIISSEVHMVKPDPAIYRLLLERQGVAPEEAVMVDDNPGNLQGAAEAGIDGILYTGVPQLLEALTPFVPALAEPGEAVLCVPNVCHAAEIAAYRQELLDADSNMDGCGSLRRQESPLDWLDDCQRLHRPDTVPEGWVPSTQYVYVRKSDGRLLGMIQLRWELNDYLTYAGHIGYSVRPSERRKGYAAAMLRALLPLCKAGGLDRVLLSCEVGNEASRRTILACGGVYHSTVTEPREGRALERYWIAL
ncbi:MAG: HAD-IA family hydrolase [Clostridiales bacterium]|nr:HAD-IA family hydrolase [Clostridiales bacterium]